MEVFPDPLGTELLIKMLLRTFDVFVEGNEFPLIAKHAEVNCELVDVAER